MSTQIVMEQLHNTRDLGGMPAADARYIRSGRLIRSGHLYGASEADQKRLAAQLELVIDLRSDQERIEKPNPQIAGVQYVQLPIMDNLTTGITREREADEHLIHSLAKDAQRARQYMCEMYRSFVTDAHACSQYARFVELLLAERDRAVLWHCTAGKDRAGFASVIVQELLGVPKEEIRRDYLMTNVYQRESVERLTELVSHSVRKEMGETVSTAQLEPMQEALHYLFGAREEYLDALYDEIRKCYGSFTDYAREALGVDAAVREQLQELYLLRN